MSVERDIESWAITAISGLSGVANVRRWADNTTPVYPQVLVQASNTARLQPNYNFYSVDMTVMVGRHLDDDPTGSATDAVIAAVETWLAGLTKASFSGGTFTGATIDGIVGQPEAGNRAAQEDKIVWQAVSRIFYTRTA